MQVDGREWKAIVGHIRLHDGSYLPAMTDGGSDTMKDNGLWRWSGPACVVSSIGFLTGAFAALDLFWSPLSALLPLGLLCWIVAIVVTLRQRKWWWAVASLPAMIIPLYIFGEIAAACARGDCL